jgi:hypothetical protein
VVPNEAVATCLESADANMAASFDEAPNANFSADVESMYHDRRSIEAEDYMRHNRLGARLIVCSCRNYY